jgi:hypothetical protein
MSIETNVSDGQIAAMFEGKNLGTVNHRKTLEQGVLQRLAGYGVGYTLTGIMFALGLIDSNDRVTKKGKKFLFAAFYDKSSA